MGNESSHKTDVEGMKFEDLTKVSGEEAKKDEATGGCGSAGDKKKEEN